jgi:hypothetical protein
MRSPEAQIRALASADAAQEAAVRSQPSDSVSLSLHSHFGANLHAPAHVPYSEAWGVGARNPAIYALVKAHWEPWLRGEIGMDRALGDLVEGL